MKKSKFLVLVLIVGLFNFCTTKPGKKEVIKHVNNFLIKNKERTFELIFETGE